MHISKNVSLTNAATTTRTTKNKSPASSNCLFTLNSHYFCKFCWLLTTHPVPHHTLLIEPSPHTPQFCTLAAQESILTLFEWIDSIPEKTSKGPSSLWPFYGCAPDGCLSDATPIYCILHYCLPTQPESCHTSTPKEITPKQYCSCPTIRVGNFDVQQHQPSQSDFQCHISYWMDR